MSKLVLSLPAKQTTAWVVDTQPKAVEAWLASLPLADTLNTVQLLYQGLFTLNRMALDTKDRLELMELYRYPVRTVSVSLQGRLTQLSLPLTSKQRRLAEFLRQLQVEMAYGYKHVADDLSQSRVSWGKKDLLALALERAIHYLGQVLLRSYHVYMSAPPAVWQEIHSLYWYAEENGYVHEALQGYNQDSEQKITISQSYLQVVLLGLCGPYQLPQNECIQVSSFLANWAHKAVISQNFDVANPAGHFLIDLTTDLPALLFPRDVKLKPAAFLRVLNAIELARSVHELISQLKKGGPIQQLNLGAECIDSACLDMLKRMMRFWGLTAGRQFSRRLKQVGYLSICAGVNAVHFFSDGQRPFSAPEDYVATPKPIDFSQGLNEAEEEAFIDLDALLPDSAASDNTEPLLPATPEVFRVDKWQIRDVSAGGMSLVRIANVGNQVRVGDVLGIQNEESGQWRLGVARWLKSPHSQQVEMGVEMLAPSVKPVAVRPVAVGNAPLQPYRQALLLPAIAAMHQPASLLLSRETYQSGQNLMIYDGDSPARCVRLLKTLERTGSFEQLVFADLQRDEALSLQSRG